MNYNSYAQLLNTQQQAVITNQALAANAAVEPDGIELKFEGDKCGASYRIRRNCIKTWEAFFYDWHEGWIELRNYGGWHNRQEAIQVCNNHAVDHRLIKFLPHRQKFKPTWGGLIGLASQLASLAAFGL